MNFSEETRKPLYVVREPRLYNFSAQQKFAALANDRAVEEAGEGLKMVKAAAINSMPELLNEAVPATDLAAGKKLIIARLKAVPDKHYRFVDGSDLTGLEAAREVERGTEKGDYFMRLEGQVLKIAREAKQRGEF